MVFKMGKKKDNSIWYIVGAITLVLGYLWLSGAGGAEYSDGSISSEPLTGVSGGFVLLSGDPIEWPYGSSETIAAMSSGSPILPMGISFSQRFIRDSVC